ncbi:MAG TPA: CRTAC1 family protein [Terriglobia bacterium]|nr:CRTAC1 family protein [Terriglobia bacterium]
MIRRPLQKSRRRFLAQVCAPFLMGTGGPRLWAAPGLAPLNHSSSESENSSPSSQVTFRDVATEAGITPTLICGNPEKNYIVEVYGSGCVWFDYNNDGYTDLYIVNGSTIENLLHPAAVKNPPRNYLFRNNGDGSFTDVTREAHVPGFGWGVGALAADYNNDGFVDLFVYNYGPNILYRNNGDGTFTDVTAQAGVAGNRLVWSAGAAFGDYDKDGYLDLYVAGHIDFDLHHPPPPGQPTCTYRDRMVRVCGPRGLKGAPDALYHNNGDGTFTDVTERAGVVDKALGYGFAVLLEDLDGDGWPDIVVANDSGPNYFYRNRKNGTFEEIGTTAGIAFNGEGQEQSNMGIAVGDYDNDGWTDLFISTFAHDNKTLFHNDGKGIFSDVSYPAGLGDPTINYLGMATFFIDYNNDGWKDIFIVNGHLYPEVDRFFGDEHYLQNPQLFANQANGKFLEVSKDVGIAALLLGGRGGAYCDYDNDGDLDMVITTIDSRPVLLRNDGGNRSGHWLQIKTMGTKSNRDGIGAWVKVVAGNLTQYDRVRTGGSWLSGNDMRLHFGLGTRRGAERVEITWPSGRVDQLSNVSADQVLMVREGEGQIASPYKPFKPRTAAARSGPPGTSRP